MGRLIKAELLKLSKSLGYKILLLCSAGMGVLVGCLLSTVETETEMVMNGRLIYMQILSDPQSIALFASIFAGIFICSEFSNRTFGISIMKGCSRFGLLLSKAAAYIIGLLSICFVCPIVGTIITTINKGFGETGIWNDLILTTFLYIMGIVAMGCFVFMLAMLIKNIGGTIGAGLGLLLVIIVAGQLAGESTAFLSIMKFTFIYQMSHILQPESFGQYYAVISSTILLTLIASGIIFERSELK